MTTETYPALADCARRRIEHEWECSGTERELLQLITALSFDLGQTWALIPCLADFAAVLGVHKSTICRALRSVRKKGWLLVLMRRDETLYSISTETRGTAAAETRSTAAETRARLVEMNKNRCQGKADADGQQRLPGILPSEETAAPAAAFAAMLEQPPHSPSHVPRETNEQSTPRAAAGDDTDAEFHARLESLVHAAEKRRQESEVNESSALPRPSPPTSEERCRLDAKMRTLCAGLKGEALHAMQRLREEFSSAGKLQEAAFFNWGSKWRQRCKDSPRLVLECAGAHKDIRLIDKPAKEPGAWIWSQMRVCAESG